MDGINRNTAKPSYFPTDGGSLDKLDKRLSSPLFKLQLGLIGEALLSIPGCFFGMPAFHLVAPFLVACALDGRKDASLGALLLALAFAIVLVGTWLFAQSLPRAASTFTSSICRRLNPRANPRPTRHPLGGDRRSQRAGCCRVLSRRVEYYSRAGARAEARVRPPPPVACDAKDIGKAVPMAAESKALPNICMMLKKGDANAAFPSGDVAGAVAFAYPLWRCASSATPLLGAVGIKCVAACCVLLSATGRMYWQAHHLLDVTCGGLVSLITCIALDRLFAFFVVADGAAASMFSSAYWFGSAPAAATTVVATAVWWHHFVAQLVLIIYAKLSGADKSTPSKGNIKRRRSSRDSH